MSMFKIGQLTTLISVLCLRAHADKALNWAVFDISFLNTMYCKFAQGRISKVYDGMLSMKLKISDISRCIETAINNTIILSMNKASTPRTEKIRMSARTVRAHEYLENKSRKKKPQTLVQKWNGNLEIPTNGFKKYRKRTGQATCNYLSHSFGF